MRRPLRWQILGEDRSSQSTKSGTRTITFDVDGLDYVAVIPGPPPFGQPIEASITPAGQPPLASTKLPADSPSDWAGLSFMCIR